MAKAAIMVLIFFGWAIHAPVAFARTDNPPPAPSLTVSVFNDARVPQIVLSRAQDRTAEILLQAGVALVWLDCGTPPHRDPNSGCDAISYPQHLSVRLVQASNGPTPDTFGQSFLDASGKGSYANIYIGAMDASKVSQTVDAGDLLGCVIAHELGHLLLGKDSHSTIGIMSARWQLTQLQQISSGSLLFSASQAEQILSRYLAATPHSAQASRPRPTSSGG